MDTPYNQLEFNIQDAQDHLMDIDKTLNQLAAQGKGDAQIGFYQQAKKDAEEQLLLHKTELAKQRQSIGRSIGRSIRR
jgi:hypothetical protein